LHADPSELTASGDAVYYGGAEVDLVYRDYAVSDLAALAKQGVDVRPMRMLFRQNRVISSIAAELDQKSCWEGLTDPQFTQKDYRGDEGQVFRRPVLGAGLVSGRRTVLADGTTGGLLEFVRREQETLVLKPNRSYGGQDVLIGHTMSSA